MPKRNDWSREQLLVALKLYCEIPFGRMDHRNPEIVRYAKLINRTPSALAMKLSNFASLDPLITSTGRKGLSGASRSDRAIWNEMTSDWSQLASEIAKVEPVGAAPRLELDESESATTDYSGSTRSATVEVRIGQAFFRRAVLSAYEFRCCITGLPIPELLVASHIVPWRQDKACRLNPRNGLCLSAIHDSAFDQGLISISEDLRVMVSELLHKSGTDPFVGSALCAFEGRTIRHPQKFFPEAEFLRLHRENVFLR
jgi:putative restriction endonuclease